jgi:dTDP-4-amino-4,6-dideoxygalactose transaminase
MVVFSFHPVKLMTTAEGGLILTDDEALFRVLDRLRTHGVTRDPCEMVSPSEGGWYYQQVDLGYNYRITDLQAALGIVQLGRLEGFLVRRRALAARYDRLLADLPLTRPWQHPDGRSSYHLYPVYFDPERVGVTRRDIYDRLREAGIGVQVHYIPVHLQPYYRRLGFSEGQFPESERYYRGALSLPLYSGLTDSEQDKVVDALRRSLGTFAT